MVYIDRNGRVLEKRPWNMERLVEIFTGLWFVVVQFFKTLFAPLTQENRSGGSSNRRGGGSWGSGGGYGGGGGGGGGGSSRGSGSGGGGSGSGDGLRPNRRIGRVTNSMDCNIPGGG